MSNESDKQSPETGEEAQKSPSLPDKKRIAAEHRTPQRRRTPTKSLADRPVLLIGGLMAFLGFMVCYFIYASWRSSRHVKTEFRKKPVTLYPVKRLVHCPNIEEFGEGRVKATYDFTALAADRKKLVEALRDWEGPYRKSGWSRPIRVDHESGLPLTPLFSKIAWQDDIELEVELELIKPVGVLFAFHSYFGRDEETGTGLRLKPGGKAQLIQFRRKLGFDYPVGKPAQLPTLKKGTVLKLRLVYRAKDRATQAFVNGEEKLSGVLHLFWPSDRAYYPGKSEKELKADARRTPGDGFVAVATSRLFAAKVRRIVVYGTVGTAWWEDRSETLGDLEKFNRRMRAKQKKTTAAEGKKTGPRATAPAGKTEKPALSPSPAPPAAEKAK